MLSFGRVEKVLNVQGSGKQRHAVSWESRKSVECTGDIWIRYDQDAFKVVNEGKGELEVEKIANQCL